eukprot:TRINITY_DN6766_c0_g1_i1.p1 TRINITY_DN6766_c0_g1~~TRINITY_DN6766_c0_g1_i1.p1  ORF type:complete len:253 (-),score=87.70 TRINITY_DN6766_c0_g1_i1:123-881(-)
MSQLEKLFCFGNLAAQSGRNEELYNIAKEIIQHEELDDNFAESNKPFFRIAFNRSLVDKRKSWRILYEEGRSKKLNNKIAKKYRDNVYKEIKDRVTEIQSLIDDKLIPRSGSHESRAFYYAISADLWRYLAEVEIYSDMDHSNAVKNSKDQYLLAYENIREANIHPAHPGSIGLVLNQTVLYYELMYDFISAYQTAEIALNEILNCEEELEEEHQQRSNDIIKLLKENMKLWQDEMMLVDSSQFELLKKIHP